MVFAICGLNHHTNDGLSISVSLDMHNMELSTKEHSVNSMLRAGVDVHLGSGVGPIHTRNLERTVGVVSS